MALTDLIEKIEEWLKGYEPLGQNWLYFNATPLNEGTTTLNTISGDLVVKRYVDGSKLKQFIASIDMVTPYDAQGTSDTNLLALKEVDSFSEWITQQIDTHNLPEIGDHKNFHKIEVLSRVPQLLVSADGNLAKYQFQIKFEYKEDNING